MIQWLSQVSSYLKMILSKGKYKQLDKIHFKKESSTSFLLLVNFIIQNIC